MSQPVAGPQLLPAQRLLEIDSDLLAVLAQHYAITIVAVQEAAVTMKPPNFGPAALQVPTGAVSLFRKGELPLAQLLWLSNMADRPEQELLLLQTPGWGKGFPEAFTKQLQTLWDEGSAIRVLTVTLVTEMPGPWQLWSQLAPSDLLKTSLRANVYSLVTLDSVFKHRLHGATHSRGWDVRPSKVLLTFLSADKVASPPAVTNLAFAENVLELELFRGEERHDLVWFCDVPDPNKQASLDTTLFLRKEIEKLPGLPEFLLTRRPSPASLRTDRRAVFVISLICVRGKMLCSLTRPSVIGREPTFVVRIS